MSREDRAHPPPGTERVRVIPGDAGPGTGSGAAEDAVRARTIWVSSEIAGLLNLGATRGLTGPERAQLAGRRAEHAALLRRLAGRRAA